MARFLCIGECMIEMAPRDDGGFSMGFAGDTFNTAWYARRLADARTEVAYLSAVGDDGPSKDMTAFIRSAGIVPELSVRAGATVGLYLISLKDGERSFSYWRSASAARTLTDDLDALPGMGRGDLAFFSGITLAILPQAGRTRLLSVLKDARKSGIRFAFDPNLRPRLWSGADDMRHWIMAAAAVSDIVLPSFEDEAEHFGDTDIRATAARYAASGCQLVVVKDGPRPVLVLSQDGEFQVEPGRVARIMDTTAAGDSFNAGFLMAMERGADAKAAAAQGCDLSAKVIGARGALVPV